MTEYRTYLYESSINCNISYDVHENGMIYRPDSGEKISLSWGDIQYIEDRSGSRVDIFLDKQRKFPISYATNEFCVLLKTICLKLSEIHYESFYTHKFSLTPKYFLHFYFVVSALLLSLIGSLFAGKALFFVLLVLFFPLGILIQRQPISLTMQNRSISLRSLFSEKEINYNEIKNIDFEVKTNDYGSTLCILINLKNRTKMTIKKFENIVLLFILLQIKLNQNIKDGASHPAAASRITPQWP